jgi:hypothetical protein
MNMIFTAKKSPFSKTNNDLQLSAPVQVVQPISQDESVSSEVAVTSLETYSKYKNILSTPDTFSDRATIFSGRKMFSRVGTYMGGCSSCGLHKKSNKPLKKNNIY